MRIDTDSTAASSQNIAQYTWSKNPLPKCKHTVVRKIVTKAAIKDL